MPKALSFGLFTYWLSDILLAMAFWRYVVLYVQIGGKLEMLAWQMVTLSSSVNDIGKIVGFSLHTITE